LFLESRFSTPQTSYEELLCALLSLDYFWFGMALYGLIIELSEYDLLIRHGSSLIHSGKIRRLKTIQLKRPDGQIS